MSDRRGDGTPLAAGPVTTGDVYCPMVTPFDDDGAVDGDALAALVDHLVERGIDGLVPCGTTGEFAALTDAEHRTVVERTVAAADGRVPVVAGTGGTAVEAVRERVAAADAAGADAALIVAPYYGGQADPAGNEAFYRAVLAECQLPAYLYDIPSAVGQGLATDTVVDLADHPTVAGVKDSTGDLTEFDSRRRRTDDDVALLQGWDAQFVPGLCMGADGGINALTQVVPEAFFEAARAVRDGDLERARERQFETIDVVFEAVREHGFAPAVKAVLADRGVVPSAAVRPPHTPLEPGDRRALLDAVAAATGD